jgi:RES domain-containing protein
VKLTLWRSVQRTHVTDAWSGAGAAQFPGRYNEAGVPAVYLADCPSGCAVELAVGYAAPEALATHLLFEVDVDAPLVDLRQPETLRAYEVTAAALTAAADYAAPRRIGAQLRADRRPGAIVPAATVARAFNVVIYPEIWSDFVVREPVALAIDRRLLRRLSAGGGRGEG